LLGLLLGRLSEERRAGTATKETRAGRLRRSLLRRLTKGAATAKQTARGASSSTKETTAWLCGLSGLRSEETACRRGSRSGLGTEETASCGATAEETASLSGLLSRGLLSLLTK
jgi:hypothetical protein